MDYNKVEEPVMIETLTDRVFVIGSAGSSNTTIITGSEGTVVVDTTLFPEKARRIRDFVKELARKPVKLVVNTHYHPDHTFGNQEFEDIDIVASSLTLEKMKDMDNDEYLEHLPKIKKIVFPSETFDEEWDGFNIIIKRVGGHTPDSSFVYLKSERILITGDLVFNGLHAEIVSDSDIESWIDILGELSKFDAEWIVPGHGVPKDATCLKLMQKYLMKFRRLIRGTINYSEILTDENFSKRGFSELFSWSVDNLLNRKAKQLG